MRPGNHERAGDDHGLVTTGQFGTTWRRAVMAVAAAAAGSAVAVVPAATLSAHTEASAVAVPALAEATVTFAPEHGCGDAPTVGVRIQAPVPDARAGDVAGWTATATPDGAGNTVLEWTGGSVPADEAGAFPLELMVPDVVGTLLAFPAVQRCADGTELAWIGTAPGDEFPAPQVLVLPAGSEPAATLDDVPLDAPGRELLVALATQAAPDDAPAPATTAAPVVAPTAAPTTAVPPTTAAPPTVAPSTAPATTASAPTTPATTDPAPTTTAGGDGDGGSAAGWIIGIIAAVVVIGGGTAAIIARRRAS